MLQPVDIQTEPNSPMLRHEPKPGAEIYRQHSINTFCAAPYRRQYEQDILPESVDLLQMLPDGDRLPMQCHSDGRQGWPGHTDNVYDDRPCTTNLDQTSVKRIGVQPKEDDYDLDDDVTHPRCHLCDQGDVYYSPRRSGNASLRGHQDGSIYFNYLQLANKRTCRSTSAIYDSRNSSRCGKLTQNICQSKLNRTNRETLAGIHIPNSRGVYNNGQKLRKKRWSKAKTCLFLLCILAGVVIALSGIVIGFIVLAPSKVQAEAVTSCRSGDVMCGERGCVSLTHICSGRVSGCLHSQNLQDMCKHNASSQGKSTSDDMHTPDGLYIVTFQPKFDKPIKDADGWVYFARGSSNGSRYTILDRITTFTSAQEECRRLGGHLAHVNSIREQVFLEDYLHQELESGELSEHGLGFWIGARRARGSHSAQCLFGQWKWIDAYSRTHDTVTGFTAFASNKPDNHYKPEECLYITYSNGRDDNSYLKWDDAPCDIHSFGGMKVLCEIEYPSKRTESAM